MNLAITPDKPKRSKMDWSTLEPWLVTGEYARIAQALDHLQRQIPTGNPLFRVSQSATRLSLACEHLQLEAHLRQQACVEINQHLRVLAEQLRAIVGLLAVEETQEPLLELQDICIDLEPSNPLQASLPEVRVKPVMHNEPAFESQPDVTQDPLLWRKLQRLAYGHLEPALERKLESQAPASSELFSMTCLGSFRMFYQEQPVNGWNGQKGLMILKYLVARHDQPVPKEQLMDVLWPDADPDAARRNLHQAVYSLRQTLKHCCPELQLICFQNERYSLNPDLPIWFDFLEFERHAEEGRRLEKNGSPEAAIQAFGIANALYQGHFLQEEAHNTWAQLQRDQLRDSFLDVANRLGRHYLEREQFAAVVSICQKTLSKDACNEEAHLHLMRCYFRQGYRHLAIAQYQSCIEVLREELGIAPSEKLSQFFHEHVLAGVTETTG
jgi:DNA-binding SARP family transcriptional activator